MRISIGMPRIIVRAAVLFSIEKIGDFNRISSHFLLRSLKGISLCSFLSIFMDFLLKNDDFFIKNDDFVFKTMKCTQPKVHY